MRERGLDAFRGLWGQILGIGHSKDALWLNTGGREHLSFVVKTELVPFLLKAFRAADEEDLVGADMLFLGYANLSPTQKLYARIKALSHVTLRLNR